MDNVEEEGGFMRGVGASEEELHVARRMATAVARRAGERGGRGAAGPAPCVA